LAVYDQLHPPHNDLDATEPDDDPPA